MNKNEQDMEDTSCDLNYIESLIAKGFTSGYYPFWNLLLNNICHNKLSEASLKHISKSVADGYIEGEVIENYQNNTSIGWWKLQT